MIGSELDAAGVRDPALREAYRRCRTINAEHGRTFFLATRLLAPEQRPAVHALYGFARRADDILDDFDPVISMSERADQLQRLATQLFNRLTQDGCGDGDPALAAVVHCARRYDIPSLRPAAESFSRIERRASLTGSRRSGPSASS